MYKKMLKRVLGCALSVCLLAGCGASGTATTSSENDGKAAESELPVLKAAVMPFLNSVPVNYIVDNGLDEKYGFKLETVQFVSGGSMNEAIASNAWDVAVMSTASVYALATYQAYLIADFADSAGGTGIYVRPDSEIASVKGYNPTYPEVMGDPDTVRGKQIIYQNGHVSHMTALKWLEKIGVNPDEVEVVNMEQASAYQAFLAGEGDAAALAPSVSYAGEEQGWVCVADLNNLDGPQNESVIATPKAYDEKHDLLVAFVKALFEANEALCKDQDLEVQLLSDWYKKNGSDIDEETVRKEVEMRPLLTAEEAKNMELGASTKANAEFFVEIGTLEADKLSIYDTNIVTDIVEEAIGYGK